MSRYLLSALSPFRIGRRWIPFLAITLCLGILRSPASAEEAGTVTTYVGSGPIYNGSDPDFSSFGGDGGTATSAQINESMAITLDRDGNLYIADTQNHRIRQVDTNGIITTVAGTGKRGNFDEGNGLPAPLTSLNSPTDLAFDPQGALHIMDMYHIWKRESSGILRIADSVTPFDYLSFGSGSIYTEHNGIIYRRLQGETSDTRIAGGGQAAPELSEKATEVKFHTDGSDVCYGSTCTQYNLEYTVDVHGNLFISDKSDHRIYKVNTTDSSISLLAGTGAAAHCEEPVMGDCAPIYPQYTGEGGPATQANLLSPRQLKADAAGNLWFLDRGFIIRKIGQAGNITTLTGELFGFSGDGGPAALAGYHYIVDFEIDPEGNLLVLDYENLRVRKIARVAAPGLVSGKPFPGNGDVNRDGRIDLADAILALRGYIGTVQLSSEARAFADTNASLNLDLGDVLRILRQSIGL